MICVYLIISQTLTMDCGDGRHCEWPWFCCGTWCCREISVNANDNINVGFLDEKRYTKEVTLARKHPTYRLELVIFAVKKCFDDL
jgi:hypothetical protein